jgi:hypothetical protein
MRRYSIWILIPLAALAGMLVLSPVEPRRAGGFDDGSFVRSGNEGRTIRSFEKPKSQDTRPLYEVNREGLAIDIDIDAETWSRMLHVQNRSVYKERATNARVRFADRPPVAATLRLRGGSSLLMPGKPNFHIELLRPEQFTPDLKFKHFYLANQRLDPHHIEGRFATGLLAELGLYPLYVQFVRVTVNGGPLGVFLLIEPPERGIRRAYENTTTIYRRFNPNRFERLWTKRIPRQSERLDRLIELGVMADDDVPSISSAYDEILDVDQFLTWIAVNSAICNRDSTDELFLFETRNDSEQPGRLRIMAWDYDDILFYKQPADRLSNPLMFAYEDGHERHVASDQAFNTRYRSILTRLLGAELSEEKLVRRLRDAQALRDSLDADDPSPAAAETARAARAAYVKTAEQVLRDRHAHLTAALAK